MAEKVSPAAARRIALAAQGFGRRRPAVVGARQVNATIERLGLLQLDSVNVFERSHYLPLFSRLGGYDRGLLDRLAFRPRGRYIEYWAHQAAVVPVETWVLMGWRRDWYRERYAGWLGERRHLVEWLRAELAGSGPLPASAIEHDANRRTGPWWGWSEVKTALELLFLSGDVVTAGRTRFERTYALPEQVLPDDALTREVDPADARRILVEHAARAYGIATAGDLADYYRMRRAEVTPAIDDLRDAGVLVPVEVRGWGQPGWLHRDARAPRRIEEAALLSPFDPVVWYRERALRLFDFHYRIEIYTPAPKRVFGYYSLPVLVDDRIVARVDLKSDRQSRTLRVQSAWREEHAPAGVEERIVPLLERARDWQGLEAISVADWGTLAAPLAGALGSPLLDASATG